MSDIRLEETEDADVLERLLPGAGEPNRRDFSSGEFYDIYVSHKKVGQIGVVPRRGLDWLMYAIEPEFRGCGVGTKAAQTLQTFLKNNAKFRLAATVDESNTPSKKIISKIGLRLDSSTTKKLREDGSIGRSELVFRLPEKRAAEAKDYPGIPNPEEYGHLSELESLVGKMTPWVVHKHEARKAGPHYDLRLSGPEGLYSWALPKARLPETPGESVLGVRQPLHSSKYREFEGELPTGSYGAGRVSIAQKGKVMITQVDKDDEGNVTGINFSLDQPGTPRRFKLSRKGSKNWYLINVTPTTTSEELGYEKPHYKKIESDEELEELIDKVRGDRPMSVKLDGALGLLRLLKNKAEVLSYRTSTEGEGIYHTERVAPELLNKRKIPEELAGKVFSGEIYGTRGGESIPVTELSGLLNSALSRARQKVKDTDTKLRMALIDVIAQNGEISGAEKRELISKAISTFPNFLADFEKAENPEEARKLLNRVMEGKHPLSREGVVFKLPDSRRIKHKGWEEHDVIIRDITPGKGKYEGTHAGAIRYSLVPGGKIVGNVGTGLSDETRRELWKNRDKYIGRVARVKSLEQFPKTKAYRAPVFAGIHPDYPTTRKRDNGEKYWGPEIERRREET